MTHHEALTRTDLKIGTRREGKVRDVYTFADTGSGEPRVLLVATDRLSAFDVVLPTPIPGKGSLLTRIAASWFGLIAERGISPTHVLSFDTGEVPLLDGRARRSVEGRVTLCRACEVIPVECVVRGYLEGSGWREYRESGTVCGIELPGGLRRGDRLPEPIFTPATKAEQGAHDENIPFERACAIAGEEVMRELRARSLRLYEMAHACAEPRGIILADTKFEFGYPVGADGQRTETTPVLVDEVFTPDSSRYWPAERWTPGREQESFDKQYVREHLQRLVDAGAWDKTAPGPELPDEVVRGTIERYEEAYARLFG